MRRSRQAISIGLALAIGSTGVSGCASKKRFSGQSLCRIDSQPIILPGHEGTARPGRHALRRWDVPLASGWDTNAEPGTEGYQRFREKIRSAPDAESQTHLLDGRVDYNSSLISMNAKRYLKPATCFERAIYGDFVSEAMRDPAVNGFDGYVLEDQAAGTARVIYELTPTEDANGPDPIDAVMEKDRRAGWALLFEIHAHPIARAAENNPSGTVAPTVSDAAREVQLHKVAGLREARITNGTATARIPADAFSYFQTER